MITQKCTVPVTPKNQDYNFRSVVKNLSPNLGSALLVRGWNRENCISLAQGEGDQQTPSFICEAATKAMQDGKTFYGPALGQPFLREEISAYYKNIYGLDVPAKRVFVTTSGSTAVHLALTALLEEDDEIVAVTPIWKNLIGSMEMAQGKIKQVPLKENAQGEWYLDLDLLFAACNERTKVLMIVTPSNPTGWVMTLKEMQAVLEFARARNLWVIADEVYSRIVYEGVRAPSFLDVALPEDKLFVVNSFSKAWAMTGWRLGWLVGPAASESVIHDIALYNNMGPPTFTQYGAVEALRHGESFIKEQLSLWRSNLDLMMDRLGQNPLVHITRPKATFYGFLRVKGEDDCIELSRFLIDEVALSLAPGIAFGDAAKGYTRICFTVSEQRFIDALDRLEQGIERKKQLAF